MQTALDGQISADAQVLVVGGRSYAFGLRWTSATSALTLMAEAKAAAIAEAANYVVIHKTYNQFGLGSIADPPDGPARWFYRPRSGAATVALATGAATLAAFPLDDDRWLVLVIDRKGILPDGDMIVASAEDAKARVAALIAQSPTTWRRRFLPDEWGIADSKTVNPNDLLSRSGAPRLRPLWQLTRQRQLRLAVAALAALIAGATFFAVRLATAPQPAVTIPFQPPPPVAAIWTPAALSLDACLAELWKAQRFNAIPRWLPIKYSCLVGSGVVVAFSRIEDGQISTIRNLLPMAQLSDDGRSAILTLPLPALGRVSAFGPFAGRQSYQAVGLDLAQRLNGTFSLQAGRKLLPGEADIAARSGWKQFTWTYQTQAPPIVWSSAVARLGSISIEALVFSPADNLWQLTGSIYASP